MEPRDVPTKSLSDSDAQPVKAAPRVLPYGGTSFEVWYENRDREWVCRYRGFLAEKDARSVARSLSDGGTFQVRVVKVVTEVLE